MNATAWRFPSVIVPVLSSSSVETSPAASTARPLIASTLRCTSRSIPAMPIAESSPPIVVGIRQTNSAIRTASRHAAARVDRERLQRDAHDQEDDRELREQDRAARSRSASSGARRPRPARSSGRGTTPPGPAVIRTLIQSDRTFVPAVTADRSPPDSRITGADSPVMADSSTEAMPSSMSPSPGISSPARHHHEVAGLRSCGCRAPSPRGRRPRGGARPGRPASSGARRPAPCRAPRPSPRRSSRTAP